MAFGTEWAQESATALLVVPSVLIPEETNVLINPAHRDAKKITARALRQFVYDPRLAAVGHGWPRPVVPAAGRVGSSIFFIQRFPLPVPRDSRYFIGRWPRS